MIRKRLLLGGVKLAGVTLGVKGHDPKPGRPLRSGWGCVEFDAQLAEHAHRAIAERLKQSAAC